jgi:hypothetical protein
MNTLDQIASKIIKEQELIIGPIAWREAKKVQGLHFSDTVPDAVTLDESTDSLTIDRLVAQYERLFGRASREACREAAAGLIADLAPSDIPLSLRSA